MSRIASLSFNVLMVFVAIAAVAAPRDMGFASTEATSARHASPQFVASELAPTGDAELLFGSFSGWRAGAPEPVTFIWSYDDNGTQKEVWALFRPNTTYGWKFPGANETSVDLTIEYENATAHASEAAFLQWCEDQYPAAMNVDKDEDFEVHVHTVIVR